MMGLTAAIALALGAVPGSADAPIVPRTAFACLLFDRADDPSKRQFRRFTFLLTGLAAKVDETSPIDTFDPSRVLGGEKFVRFTKGAGGPNSYVALTGKVTDPKTLMLSLRPSKERDYEAGLGAKGKMQFVCRCMALESADTAGDYAKFNARLFP